MYRFLVSRRWLSGLAFALAAALVCVLLGVWQWHRREARLARNAVVIANYDRAPQPLAQVLDPQVLPASQEWAPVRLQGRYLADATILVRNRPLDGAPGYRVLVPFQLDPDVGIDSSAGAGQVLLVDRGWLPIGATGQGPDTVPMPPRGDVDVVARLRPPEPTDQRGAPQGQTQRITPAALAEDVAARADVAPGALITSAYAMMASESPAVSTTPRALPRPEIDEGPHLSYALQWVVFAVFFVGGWVMLARRQAADLAWEEQTGQPAYLRPRGGPARDDHVRDEDIEDSQVDLGGTPGYDSSPTSPRR